LNAHGEQVFFTDAERNAITSSTYKRVYADYLYLDENRKNIWVFNLRLSKSLGRSSEFSFFVNNFFNYQPLYRRLRSPSEAYTRENPELYFGIEISSKIDELFQFKRRS
jgi:hypothetical protein